jgi:hypothetical protein
MINKMNKYKISFIYYLRLKCVLNLQSSFIHYVKVNRIGGVMVSVLASSAVDHGFKPRSGQTKDYKIGIKDKQQRLVGSESG